MKNNVLFLFLCFTTLVSQAAYKITWDSDGFLLQEGSEPGSATPIGGSSTAEVLYALYYTPDTESQYFPPSSAEGDTFSWGGQTGGVGNDNKLVNVERDNFSFSSRDLEVTEDYEGETLPTTGFFYSVSFEFNDVSVDTNDPNTWNFSVPVGTFAYIAPSVLVPFSTDPLDLPTEVLVNHGGTFEGDQDAPAGSAIANTQLIPEPGTAALLVLGGLVAFKASRRRR